MKISLFMNRHSSSSHEQAFRKKILLFTSELPASREAERGIASLIGGFALLLLSGVAACADSDRSRRKTAGPSRAFRVIFRMGA
jgi:hypothetical protein